MAKYNYGRKFLKNGETVQYRYVGKRIETKTLVYAHNKRPYYDDKMKSYGRKRKK